MIEGVEGKLVKKDPARALIDVGGVVLLVRIPVSTYDKLPSVESRVHLFTRFRVSQDDMRLFGFSKAIEREVFDLLLSVSGIGPKTALSVISSTTPRQFARAVADEDVTALTGVPGIGPKTAQRLIFELRDQVGRHLEPAVEGQAAGEFPDAVQEASLALLSLGYDRKAVRRALKKLHGIGEKSVEEILRKALSKL